MENENIEKKKFPKAIIFIIILLVVSLGIGFAYARYITRLNGTTQVPIATWNFRVTAGSSQNLSIDLADTRYANDTTEVDRTKVAPGTKGAIQFNINASESQVSLQYDIDMSLTQIPENLIFYFDSNMTNAILKENGNIHLEGFFGANDTNKTATKKLYWQWKLETGTAQAEIDSNDLLDSSWMGERITLGIEATGRQVMENSSSEYTVTFDLNGGKLANHGDSTQITKQVKYGEAYGTLPTPTREGYTFVGWNGKNIIDKSKSTQVGIQNETPVTAWADTCFNSNWVKNNLYPDKTYSISYDIEGVSVPEYDSKYNGNLGFLLYSRAPDRENYPTVYLMSGSGYYIQVGEKIHVAKTFTTPPSVNLTEAMYYIIGYTNRYLKDDTGVYSSVIISNIQLEEGLTATAYEPYLLSSSTPVTQNKNHTLIAIWEKN